MIPNHLAAGMKPCLCDRAPDDATLMSVPMPIIRAMGWQVECPCGRKTKSHLYVDGALTAWDEGEKA